MPKRRASEWEQVLSLIILGAGPAGCAAAISARLNGFSVALIETPGPARQLPGETLHPGVEPLLRQLGVWADIERCGFHRHSGIWRVDANGTRRFEAFGNDANGPWRGLQVDRVKFHKLLRQKAIATGVRWIEASKLASASQNQSGWVVECSAGTRHEASVVMDATGRRAWLSKQLALTADRLCEVQRVQFGWSDADLYGTDENPIFCARKDGWEWSAPIDEKRVAWVRLKRGGTQPGLDVTPRIFRTCAGPGWFLLGDAACLTTPASGNGVLRALMSGIYAIHIHRAISTGQLPQRMGVANYCAWIRKFWDSTVSATENYRFENSFQPHPYVVQPR